MGLPRYRIPQPRQKANVDTLRKALQRASRLTEAEIRETMDAVRQCATRMREGVATELQVQTLRSTMLIALEIERLGYVRGMSGHIDAALVAIKSVLDRGNESGEWHPTPLRYYELDAITCMVDLHDHQLRQLSAAELHTASKRVIAHMQSQGGGELLHVAPSDLGLEVSA
ncbi:hypothetical protein A1D30_21680 [Acidovorax sp. GW101-3H11]|uniref:hypothetical protein n=1 Tax=Acidovorax sp. GW101-3H11 TaxID=1813946 RepID=UPI0007B53F68|nr:hypothetical protein [Acidovorax sp. GW101-3H11]KZT13725.1 hypothetical protein A1D30_21680 [Acidovorax sp. GW101-3H11]